jgi:hypothetical protein
MSCESPAYVEHETLDTAALEARIAAKEIFHCSVTLEAQLGGMTNAGFVLTGFYESEDRSQRPRWSPPPDAASSWTT